MSIDTRLSKLFPVLTAKERAILVRRALRAGEDAGEIRNVPTDQRHEYNRYMGVCFAASLHLGNLIQVLARQVNAFDFAVGRMELLDKAAMLLEEDYPDTLATEPVRAWDKLQRAKNTMVSMPYFLRSLAQEIREDLHKELCFRWQELRAAEVVAAELGSHFDGDDVLEPNTRTELETTLDTARALNSRLSPKRRLPEPGQEFLEHTRGVIEQGFAALNLVEL